MTLLDSRHRRAAAPRLIPKAARAAAIGARVRIERDETLYSSKGTWPEFRGRTGTIIEINVDRKRPHLTEYGVVFGKTRVFEDGSIRAADGRAITTWFKFHEIRAIRALAAERHADASLGRTLVGVS
jgi:hypothetical protein